MRYSSLKHRQLPACGITGIDTLRTIVIPPGNPGKFTISGNRYVTVTWALLAVEVTATSPDVSGGFRLTPSATAACTAAVCAWLLDEPLPGIGVAAPLAYRAPAAAHACTVCVAAYARQKSQATTNIRLRNGNQIASSAAAAAGRFSGQGEFRILLRMSDHLMNKVDI
jgi:hypothetical protein